LVHSVNVCNAGYKPVEFTNFHVLAKHWPWKTYYVGIAVYWQCQL